VNVPHEAAPRERRPVPTTLWFVVCGNSVQGRRARGHCTCMTNMGPGKLVDFDRVRSSMGTAIRLALAGALLLSSAGLVPGCGGQAKTAETDFWDRYAELYCTRGKACEPPGNGFEDWCEITARLPSLASEFDSTAAQQCLVEMETWSCCDELPTSCSRAAFGTAPLGQACSSGSDCALSDEGPVTCHNGACKVDVPPAAGQPCWMDQDDSTHRYSCSLDPRFMCDKATKLCVPRGEVGATCMFDSDCAVETFCSLGEGQCKPRGAVGEACSGASCVPGATCNGTQCIAEPAGVCPAS